MKETIKRIIKKMPQPIIDIILFINDIIGKPKFYSDLHKFKKQKKQINDADFIFGRLYPCLIDKYSNNGSAKGDYFHQDLLVARRIYENNPKKHVDIGSRVDGFVAHVASFRDIIAIDIRPSVGQTHNIKFVQQDFMSELKDDMIDYCDSLSSLHAMEHFGLGRFGDAVDFQGHIVGINNLHKMLKKGGKLYFSVPIGTPQRIEFNAHRIFSPKYLVKQFEEKYNFDMFSYVDGNGDLHENIDIESFKNTYSDIIGCGIFEMTKL
jgi:SAM-dependent methyltransferase